MDILNQIKNKLKSYPDVYLTNEQATRNQLIDPVLRELGWDPTDPSKVLPNASNEDGKKPDYTLIKNNSPILILEAKNTSVDLEKGDVIKQLAQYCYNMGVKYGFLSNGQQWLFYNTFETDPNKRIIWKIDVTKDEMTHIVNDLEFLKYENANNLETIVNGFINQKKLNSILESIWDEKFSSIEKIKDLLSKLLETYIKKQPINTTIDSKRINEFVSKKLDEMVSYKQTYEPMENTFNKVNYVEDNNIIPTLDDYGSHREKIRVQFPDGTEYSYHNVTDTFVQTIQKIGLERVRNLNIETSSVTLISTSKHPKYSQRHLGKYYLMVDLSTRNKFNILQKINKMLNLGLKIEIV